MRANRHFAARHGTAERHMLPPDLPESTAELTTGSALQRAKSFGCNLGFTRSGVHFGMRRPNDFHSFLW
jgi:hypothetical protein